MTRPRLSILAVALSLGVAPVHAQGCHLWLQFGFGSAAILPDGRAVLDKAARLYPGAGYTITGHADAPGTEFENLAISRRRVEAVSDYLAGQGVTGVVRMTAMGQAKLLKVDHGPVALNRRVEVQLSPCSKAVLAGS